MTSQHNPYAQLTEQNIYTPGPVKMTDSTLALGSVQTPYFRNAAFSQILLECERGLLRLARAPEGSRVVFLTAAGTAAMEAVVTNLLPPGEAVAVVNGGTFGQRFVDICRVHQRPTLELKVDRDPLTDGQVLSKASHASALLINAHETSVGHQYDLQATGTWCRRQGALHIVDAISLFITDPLDMTSDAIDALVVSSHKGLALPPGLAMVLLSPRALAKVRPSGSYYLDFGAHLRDGERGQTPFTPAVSIVLQLHQRLDQLLSAGIETEWRRASTVASHFRRGIATLPLKPYSTHMPSAMTALEVSAGLNAAQVVETLESQHHCVVAPNGGALRDRVFRVSHMGATNIADMERLLTALKHTLGEKQ